MCTFFGIISQKINFFNISQIKILNIYRNRLLNIYIYCYRPLKLKIVTVNLYFLNIT
jgi:hypothetical protein